ncbi:MAG: ABC transporter permease [Microbacteriaceae bacterium]|nr:ABC transporter permease [Microbacteriaceae bacterium]
MPGFTDINRFKNDPRYATPGKSRGLVEIFKHRYLLRLLTNKGVATRYYGSVLGWLWSYIKPGAQFLMFFIVIGVIMGADRSIQWYPIYLFAGIVAVNLFSEVLNNATLAVTDNAPLINKIFLPRELFPAAACGVALTHFVPQALLLFAIALFCGWQFGFMAVLSLLGGVALILIFALGLGLFFGAVNAIFRDAKNLVDLLLMFATWISPVLYSFNMVKDQAPSWLYHAYMSNPMTVAVELFHNAFWLPIAPDSARPDGFERYVLIGFGVALLSLFIGQLVFRKLEGTFAQRL